MSPHETPSPTRRKFILRSAPLELKMTWEMLWGFDSNILTRKKAFQLPSRSKLNSSKKFIYYLRSLIMVKFSLNTLHSLNFLFLSSHSNKLIFCIFFSGRSYAFYLRKDISCNSGDIRRKTSRKKIRLVVRRDKPKVLPRQTETELLVVGVLPFSSLFQSSRENFRGHSVTNKHHQTFGALHWLFLTLLILQRHRQLQWN